MHRTATLVVAATLAITAPASAEPTGCALLVSDAARGGYVIAEGEYATVTYGFAATGEVQPGAPLYPIVITVTYGPGQTIAKTLPPAQGVYALLSGVVFRNSCPAAPAKAKPAK